MAIRIAKAGFFGGDPEAVLRAPTDIVLKVLSFESEQIRYMDCYEAINKED